MDIVDIERIAFAEGRMDVVRIIHQSEEEMSNEITFDHQLVIDDRNRLFEALEACDQLLTDAALSPLRAKLIDIIEPAMKAVESQSEETLNEKMVKVEAKLKSANVELNTARHELARLRSLKYTAQHLVRAFIGKNPPKWAQTLSNSLKEST